MISKGLFLFLLVCPFLVSCTDTKQKKIDEINKTVQQYEKVIIDGKPRICKDGKPLSKDELSQALDELQQLNEQLDEIAASISGGKEYGGTDLELQNDRFDWARKIEKNEGRSAWGYTQVFLMSLAMNASEFAPPTDHLNPNLYHSSRQNAPYVGGQMVQRDLPKLKQSRRARRGAICAKPKPRPWKKRGKL